MCLVLLPNVHRQLMAAALTMTQCRLQALLALVRLPCSEPPPASLFLTWLCTEMFFSLSALGRDWSCYPSQSMSVNFLVPRGLSTSGSAWEVALVTLSARLHSHSSGTPSSTVRTALAESCSPQHRKNPAVTSQGSHREGDLLTQSKSFIFSLVGEGSGCINKGCSESE